MKIFVVHHHEPLAAFHTRLAALDFLTSVVSVNPEEYGVGDTDVVLITEVSLQ